LKLHRTEFAEEDRDALVARRYAFLLDFQDKAYTQKYRDMVARVRAAEAKRRENELLTGLRLAETLKPLHWNSFFRGQ
jgi:hypothetical protein